MGIKVEFNPDLALEKNNFLSIPKQAKRLEERKTAKTYETNCCGLKIIVNSGVYQTSGDSELMAEVIEINNNENFLEIGCGTGIISIILAKRGANGFGVDINEKAVENSKQNAEKYKIKNVNFFKSDVFENIKDKFDVIICNPPYTNHEVYDNIDRMFWDPEDEMKIKFFSEVGVYLNNNGRIYFGWANFVDINVNLPFELAKANGYKLIKIFSKSHDKDFNFYVFEFQKIDQRK